ncbi:hypothetical protein C0J45_19810 [Silurus meridionalis]|uniref:Uncharacterized protein n=1 Tax=Silurus meridionalis TaxID=175797 RepID=A0A8T0AGX6_SILME|nr:hypothetical protein HF521_012463 [Silurus meridionalis]KAI5090949.1 hypothetical protein C0J45_19810 [Silurus meridionalis]
MAPGHGMCFHFVQTKINLKGNEAPGVCWCFEVLSGKMKSSRGHCSWGTCYHEGVCNSLEHQLSFFSLCIFERTLSSGQTAICSLSVFSLQDDFNLTSSLVLTLFRVPLLKVPLRGSERSIAFNRKTNTEWSLDVCGDVNVLQFYLNLGAKCLQNSESANVQNNRFPNLHVKIHTRISHECILHSSV